MRPKYWTSGHPSDWLFPTGLVVLAAVFTEPWLWWSAIASAGYCLVVVLLLIFTANDSWPAALLKSLGFSFLFGAGWFQGFQLCIYWRQGGGTRGQLRAALLIPAPMTIACGAIGFALIWASGRV